MDVLDHHHGVVHQHADAEHQTEQSEDVELRAQGVHRTAGDQQRERDGGGDHQRGAEAAQKEVQYHNREKAAVDAGVAQTRQRVANRLALVFPDQKVDAFELGVLLDLLDALEGLVHDFDGIGAGFFVDVDTDRKGPVEMASVVEARFAHLDPGHIADAEAVVADAQIGDLTRGLESGQGANLVTDHVAADDACVHILVGGVDGGKDLAGADAVPPESVEVEVDPDLLLFDPVEVDPGHALDALEGAADTAVEKVPGLRQIAFGGDPPGQHLGAAAVGVAADRDVADGVRQEGAGAVDGLADLHLLDVDVDPPIEHHLHPRRPGLGVAENPLDVGDGGDLFLEGFDDLSQGLERVRSRERDLDVDFGLVDHRHEVERQQKDRHRAQYGQAQEEHEGRDGSVQGNVGQAHDVRPNFEF